MSNPSDNELADIKQGVRGADVFVGGLTPSITETKIREVFSTCGEIIGVRMIMDNKGSSKGYCFVQFSTREAAVKAVKDKAGTVLEGRKIGVLPSTEKKSLFLGNLPKEWSTDDFNSVLRQVFEDVESVKLVTLPNDGVPLSQKKKNRGFGFVQFATHAAAARAFRVGSRADFIMGGNCHPTVQWTEEEPEIDQEELAKIKIAFVRNLPTDITEGALRKLFGRYGEIEKVVLPKKGSTQAGFVHFAKRQDLEAAVKELNDMIVEAPDVGSFKLQVEVARPFERNKKRAREAPSKTASQSKSLRVESTFPYSGDHVLEVLKEPVLAEPYEAAVVSLPVAVKDRLLRIMRLGIATRYDIDIQCLRSLMELPESAAISVLDQFLVLGADEIDKGAFLIRLIQKYMVRSPPRASQIPEYTSRGNYLVSARPELSRLSDRGHMPIVDSLPSHLGSTASRYDAYSPPRLDYSRSGMLRMVDERNPSSPLDISSSLPSYGRRGVGLPVTVGPSPLPLLSSSSPSSYGRRVVANSVATAPSLPQTTRTQMRFDPYTGEPYKFDPFTGEPIRPDSASRDGGGGRLY